jgi:hypothetical protein
MASGRRGRMQREFQVEFQVRTVSGRDVAVVPSHARPTKPPAKEITARRLSKPAARGEQLPSEVRVERSDPTTRRSKVIGKAKVNTLLSTRAGKRTPYRGRAAAAADAREAKPSRKAGTRETDPGIRAVPVTRRHHGSRGARG